MIRKLITLKNPSTGRKAARKTLVLENAAFVEDITKYDLNDLTRVL